jgi:uncharacterized protein
MIKRFFMFSLLLAPIGASVSCTVGRPGVPALGDPTEQTHHENPGIQLAMLFRDYISAVDGDRCPSIPTCSAYSAEVFKRYGFFKGWIMTVDRLIHEADEGGYSPLVYRDGKIRILDPPESNDIW